MSKYSLTTKMPALPDDLIYFQDATVDEKDNIDKWSSDINGGKYVDAQKELANYDSFCADLLNMMQIRLQAAQKAINKNIRTTNSFIYHPDDAKNAVNGQIYINVDESMNS